MKDCDDYDSADDENVYSIPPFTAEQELMEKASLTAAEERQSIMTDVFGLGQTLSGMTIQSSSGGNACNGCDQDYSRGCRDSAHAGNNDNYVLASGGGSH